VVLQEIFANSRRRREFAVSRHENANGEA